MDLGDYPKILVGSNFPSVPTLFGLWKFSLSAISFLIINNVHIYTHQRRMLNFIGSVLPVSCCYKSHAVIKHGLTWDLWIYFLLFLSVWFLRK